MNSSLTRAYDFAGGTVIHIDWIQIGAAVVVLGIFAIRSWLLRKRK